MEWKIGRKGTKGTGEPLPPQYIFGYGVGSVNQSLCVATSRWQWIELRWRMRHGELRTSSSAADGRRRRHR